MVFSHASLHFTLVDEVTMAAAGVESESNLINHYMCVECGQPAKDLYRQLTTGVLKISHCTACGKVVDKYIEFDNTIICLDLLLHKFQAYRHLIFNNNLVSFWKLQLILLLCDAFMKWDTGAAAQHDGYSRVFYAALEVEFYKLFGLATTQWITSMLSIYIMLKLRRVIIDREHRLFSLELVFRGMTLSSFARLLTIPAIVFGQTHSPLCLFLIKLLLTTSCTSMLKVVCKMYLMTAFILVALGTILIPTVTEIAYIHM